MEQLFLTILNRAVTAGWLDNHQIATAIIATKPGSEAV